MRENMIAIFQRLANFGQYVNSIVNMMFTKIFLLLNTVSSYIHMVFKGY